jgi:hypothetical protein
MVDMIGYYATKPLQGGLFRKFRDQLMGVTPEREPGPGKTDGSVGKTETNKRKPKKGKVIHLVPPWKEAAPQECVGGRNRDPVKAGPGLLNKLQILRSLTIQRERVDLMLTRHAWELKILQFSTSQRERVDLMLTRHAWGCRITQKAKILHLTSLK